jgi:hypothetical protein
VFFQTFRVNYSPQIESIESKLAEYKQFHLNTREDFNGIFDTLYTVQFSISKGIAF